MTVSSATGGDEREAIRDLILCTPRVLRSLGSIQEDSPHKIDLLKMLDRKLDRFLAQTEGELAAKAAILQANHDGHGVEAMDVDGQPSDRALVDRHLQLFDPAVRAALVQEFLSPLRGEAKYKSSKNNKSSTFLLLLSGANGVGKSSCIHRLAMIANREIFGITLDSDLDDECPYVLYFSANTQAHNPGKRLITLVGKFFAKHSRGILFIVIDEVQCKGLGFYDSIKSLVDNGTLDLSSLKSNESANTLPQPHPACQLAICLLSNSGESILTAELRDQYRQMGPAEAQAVRTKLRQHVVKDSFGDNAAWYSRLSRATVLPMFEVDKETMEKWCPLILTKANHDHFDNCLHFDTETMLPWLMARWQLDRKGGIRFVQGELHKYAFACANKFHTRRVAIFAEQDDEGEWKQELTGAAMPGPEPAGTESEEQEENEGSDEGDEPPGDESAHEVRTIACRKHCTHTDARSRSPRSHVSYCDCFVSLFHFHFQSDSEFVANSSDSSSETNKDKKKMDHKKKKKKDKKKHKDQEQEEKAASSKDEKSEEQKQQVIDNGKPLAERKDDLPDKLNMQQAHECLQLAVNAMAAQGEAPLQLPERVFQAEGVEGGDLLAEYRSHVTYCGDKLKSEKVTRIHIFAELGKVAKAYETHLWPQEKSKLLAAREASLDAVKKKIDVNARLAAVLGFDKVFGIKGSNKYVTHCKQILEVMVTYHQPALPYLFKALPLLGQDRFFGWLIPLRAAAKEKMQAMQE